VGVGGGGGAALEAQCKPHTLLSASGSQHSPRILGIAGKRCCCAHGGLRRILGTASQGGPSDDEPRSAAAQRRPRLGSPPARSEWRRRRGRCRRS
jgi:hypothetical protein